MTRPSAVVEKATSLLRTRYGREILRSKRSWVETVNADLKNNGSLSRACYRGNAAVTIQILLSASAHNLYKLVKKVFSDRTTPVAARKAVPAFAQLAA